MRFFLLIVIGAFFTACAPKEPLYTQQNYVFGTLVDISIYGESDDKAQVAANGVAHIFQDLHNRLHAWQPSELSNLNQAFSSNAEPTIVAADIAAMIQDATRLSEISEEKFNPAIGKLIALWGFQSDEFKPITPTEDEIKQLVAAHPQMRDIIIKNNTVTSRNPSVKLDFGGYAKGYALDVARDYLHQQDIRNALINIGGNIIAIGQHGNKPWRVGIQNPRAPSAIAMLDLPDGWAIGTSGDYQRYFEFNGKRFCHIIDPATGYPVQGVQAVTVLIPPSKHAGALSDVASKPIFISKPDDRSHAAEKMGVADYLIIESSQHIQVSASMASKLKWLDKSSEHFVSIIQ